MKISGWQKTSLIDYPGHIVTIIFTQGCNCHCPWCHNSELLPARAEDDEDNYLLEEDFFSFLQKRKGLIDGVAITGGEPTMQPDLVDFVGRVKATGMDIKLDSNGSRPDVLKELFERQLIDYEATDIKAPLDKYALVAGTNAFNTQIVESIKIILDMAPDYEFRTTVVPGLHDEGDMEAIGKLVKGAKRFYIQNFHGRETIVDPKYRNLNGFTPDKLERFRNIVAKYVEEVEIRI